MPKGFSDREKEIIRIKLFEEGTRLFDQFGVQKTTVEEIARASGISKGSFYTFYHSKEELFFDILEHSERKFKEKFFGQVFPASKSYSEGFKLFIEGFFTMMESMPLFKNLSSSDLEYLMRKLPEERIKGHMKQDYAVFEEFYRTWVRKGIFRNLDLKGFTGVMRLLFYLVLHQDDYPPDEYRATKDIFANMLCDYVVVKQRSKK